MPRITGNWTRGQAPGGGRWYLTVPNRVTGLDGTEILPKGLYENGDLTAQDDGTWTLDVTIPSSTGTSPPGWQPTLTVAIYDGGDEVYVLDVSGTADIDLGTILLPQDVDDPVENLVRGVPGGLAALDAAGDVVDAEGHKVISGMVEFATLDETIAGTEDQKATTPAGVKARADAGLVSPAFAGIPTAPTPAPTDSSTRLATTAYVTGAVSAEVTERNQAITQAIADAQEARNGPFFTEEQWTASTPPDGAYMVLREI